jgi:hypothetical protein
MWNLDFKKNSKNMNCIRGQVGSGNSSAGGTREGRGVNMTKVCYIHVRK